LVTALTLVDGVITMRRNDIKSLKWLLMKRPF